MITGRGVSATTQRAISTRRRSFGSDRKAAPLNERLHFGAAVQWGWLDHAGQDGDGHGASRHGGSLPLRGIGDCTKRTICHALNVAVNRGSLARLVGFLEE